ncbi:hypothetical protein PSPO01_07075 [Paraphaeosphaeria sporulosa]
MVKPLSFKGDKKVKKRKRVADDGSGDADARASKAPTTASASATDAAQEDDSWVSADAPTDISGPIIVVLPTELPTCLACDANGKVFCSQIENCVDGDAATSEPHDVRQVWVATRVAGTESFSLKGHHGRYLGCDKYGIPSATSTAISPAESFTVIPIPDNPSTFGLQTARDTFLTVDDSKASGPDVRGDAEAITFNTTLRIRMQARFKPRHKVAKAEKALEKISKKELEDMIGRRLDDDEVKKLRKARREGTFHEVSLAYKVKTSHDKYA